MLAVCLQVVGRIFFVISMNLQVYLLFQYEKFREEQWHDIEFFILIKRKLVILKNVKNDYSI